MAAAPKTQEYVGFFPWEGVAFKSAKAAAKKGGQRKTSKKIIAPAPRSLCFDLIWVWMAGLRDFLNFVASDFNKFVRVSP